MRSQRRVQSVFQKDFTAQVVVQIVWQQSHRRSLRKDEAEFSTPLHAEITNKIDPWILRDRFLSVPEGDRDALINFLDTAGYWHEEALPQKRSGRRWPRSSSRLSADGLLKAIDRKLSPSPFPFPKKQEKTWWDRQKLLRVLLEATPELYKELQQAEPKPIQIAKGRSHQVFHGFPLNEIGPVLRGDGVGNCFHSSLMRGKQWSPPRT